MFPLPLTGNESPTFRHPLPSRRTLSMSIHILYSASPIRMLQVAADHSPQSPLCTQLFAFPLTVLKKHVQEFTSTQSVACPMAHTLHPSQFQCTRLPTTKPSHHKYLGFRQCGLTRPKMRTFLRPGSDSLPAPAHVDDRSCPRSACSALDWHTICTRFA